jgi:glycosyltransferase involved in cell wall biosynthesis
VKICFILPGSSPTPTGGVKNIYEHANRLAARGHRVTILHAAYVTRQSGVLPLGRAVASYLLNRLGVMQWRPDRWFRIDPRVDMRWAPTPAPCRVPDGDVVVATAWQTAEWVREYPPAKGEKFYFAMDYERYMEADPELRQRISATHTAGLRTMVISPAGRDMVEACGGRPPSLVPCALEFSIYRLVNGIDSELRTMIGFPTRPERHKATEDAIKALELVRSGTGFGGSVWSFGGERLPQFPEWADYHLRPSDMELASLYNLTRIFIVPSIYEGWGLPGSEAMACGAALVSTDNGGVRAYAEHGRTALLTPAGDPAALAAAIRSLLGDNDLRTRLARAGYEHVQQFTWDRAADDLERSLSGKG